MQDDQGARCASFLALRLKDLTPCVMHARLQILCLWPDSSIMSLLVQHRLDNPTVSQCSF